MRGTASITGPFTVEASSPAPRHWLPVRLTVRGPFSVRACTSPEIALSTIGPFTVTSSIVPFMSATQTGPFSASRRSVRLRGASTSNVTDQLSSSPVSGPSAESFPPWFTMRTPRASSSARDWLSASACTRATTRMLSRPQPVTMTPPLRPQSTSSAPPEARHATSRSSR